MEVHVLCTEKQAFHCCVCVEIKLPVSSLKKKKSIPQQNDCLNGAQCYEYLSLPISDSVSTFLLLKIHP